MAAAGNGRWEWGDSVENGVRAGTGDPLAAAAAGWRYSADSPDRAVLVAAATVRRCWACRNVCAGVE